LYSSVAAKEDVSYANVILPEQIADDQSLSLRYRQAG
jgi:hypothetical protein